MRVRCYPQSVVDIFERLPVFQKERLDAMSFRAFLRMPPLELQRGLLQGVVERYCPETRTIVTQVGEFVPSLEDMVLLIGLRVHREPLTGVM